MNRPSGLGRGLGALIPTEVSNSSSESFQSVAVSSIHPNQYQPRDHFDEETLESLAASIRELGVLQPILVRRDGSGYELIAGERRWRAAQLAGLEAVPVIVRDADDMSSLEQALVENLHRQDLNALEEAAAYQQLIDDFGFTQAKVATRVGRSRSAVANILRLLTLPTNVARLVSDGSLSAGHARAILGLDDVAEQVALATRAVDENLTVREVERLVKSVEIDLRDDPAPEPSPLPGGNSTPGTTREPGLLELEKLLSDHLETTVSVSLGKKRGRIVIDYADLADLERIYGIIAP